MLRFWLPWLIIFAATLFVAGELAYFYPQLPDPMASHFDFEGVPDGWMPKEKFLGVMGGTWIMLLVLLAIPTLLAMKIPASLVNLPHKDYWLAPQRSKETRRVVARRMSWISAATMLLMGCLWHETIVANLPPHPPLSIWTPFVLYLAFTVLWCGELIWRFGRLPESTNTSE